MRMKGDCWGLIWPLVSSHFLSEVTHLALIRALVLCVLFLQSEDSAAHLNSSTWGIASVGREGRTQDVGEYKQNTFPELPDTEIGMCSVPPGLREQVLLSSNGASE